MVRAYLPISESQQVFTTVQAYNPAIVLPTLPVPNANQEILYYQSWQQNRNAEINAQICTVNSEFDYYLIGVVVMGDANGCVFALKDGLSGTIPQTDAEINNLCYLHVNSANRVFFPPLPLKVKQGIRLGNITPLSGTTVANVIYIRERKIRS